MKKFIFLLCLAVTACGDQYIMLTRSINSSGNICDKVIDVYINNETAGSEILTASCNDGREYLVMNVMNKETKHTETKVLSCEIANEIDGAECFTPINY